MKRIIFYFPAIFLITIFITSVFTANLFDTKRLAQSLLLTVIVLSIKTIPLISKKNKVILSILLLIGFYSSILSNSQLTSFLHFLHYILLLSLVILGIKISTKLSPLFFSLFLFNIIIVSCSILNCMFYILNSESPNIYDVTFGFNNIRFFNQMQVICIPILIYYLKKDSVKNIAALFIIFNIFFILLTGGRGALISLLMMLLIGYILKIVKVETLKKLFFYSVIAFSLFLFYTYSYPDEHSLNYISRTTSSGRLDIWQHLVSNLKIKNLILGNGLGSYLNIEQRVRHPHNSILQVLNDWGLAAAAFFFFLFLKITKHLRLQLKNKSIEYETCTLVFIVLAFYSLLTGIIITPIPQTFLFVFIGIILGYKNKDIIFVKVRLNYYILIILTLVLYLFTVLLSYKCKDSSFLGPNFWGSGEFSLTECHLLKENHNGKKD